MTGTIDYAGAGPLTRIDMIHEPALANLPSEAVEICRLVHDLVIQPTDAKGLGVPDERFAENQLRPVDDLIGALLALDPAPLTVARDPDRRVIGTCRHFAVLSCALLRYRGIAARARCGFATYFQPGQGVDHWITEYRHDGRWVRIDSEILGSSLLAKPENLAAGEFLTGGEAWTAFRDGHIDAAHFGVYGTENWGPAEIRGNAIKDLAALNKVEMLPWDEWGRMEASYKGKTGPDYDELIDAIAAVCATDDPGAIADLYAAEDLAVPTALLQ
ncbi:transglutaminase [Micromonospora globispora]|uniref:transglutaminase domain-containing protein n=1 Tax=Micromonospora globispora TaxID=1450148 RepID=UPI000D703DA4|nr:transglutaminase domain-containing protein [Micromonospora globispora]PWU59169.1 transglutaminase [Micromonospora globispora]RQW96194.1 transglutaminase [Micromonospora globispora]